MTGLLSLNLNIWTFIDHTAMGVLQDQNDKYLHCVGGVCSINVWHMLHVNL